MYPCQVSCRRAGLKLKGVSGNTPKQEPKQEHMHRTHKPSFATIRADAAADARAEAKAAESIRAARARAVELTRLTRVSHAADHAINIYRATARAETALFAQAHAAKSTISPDVRAAARHVFSDTAQVAALCSYCLAGDNIEVDRDGCAVRVFCPNCVRRLAELAVNRCKCGERRYMSPSGRLAASCRACHKASGRGRRGKRGRGKGRE